VIFGRNDRKLKQLGTVLCVADIAEKRIEKQKEVGLKKVQVLGQCIHHITRLSASRIPY
jgi:hypothetical protein